jgi:hypothetical protein
MQHQRAVMRRAVVRHFIELAPLAANARAAGALSVVEGKAIRNLCELAQPDIDVELASSIGGGKWDTATNKLKRGGVAV